MPLLVLWGVQEAYFSVELGASPVLPAAPAAADGSAGGGAENDGGAEGDGGTEGDGGAGGDGDGGKNEDWPLVPLLEGPRLLDATHCPHHGRPRQVNKRLIRFLAGPSSPEARSASCAANKAHDTGGAYLPCGAL